MSLAACFAALLLTSPAPALLETPAAPGSGQPNLAVAPDGRVLLSWIEPSGEGRHALRFAARGRGEPWGPPRTIAEGAGWFVNWADFPSLAVLPDGTLFAHWLAKSGPGAYAYHVHVSVSRDGGATWSPSVVPHRDATDTEHGFLSFAPREAGRMDLVWLDGRATGGGGHGAGGGAMSLAYTTMAADGRLGEETIVDARVCDCCQTDAAVSSGATVVAYRDRSEAEVRDVSVVRLAGGRWSPPVSVAEDGWRIEGCPVNGPAIAARGATVAVAWFTAAGGTGRVKVAFSRDSGATFGPAAAVDDGRPLGRVDVVLDDGGGALVSWLEHVEDGAALRVRRIGADGVRGPALTVSAGEAGRASGFPRMAESGGEVTIAWRDGGAVPTVKSATLRR